MLSDTIQEPYHSRATLSGNQPHYVRNQILKTKQRIVLRIGQINVKLNQELSGGFQQQKKKKKKKKLSICDTSLWAIS